MLASKMIFSFCSAWRKIQKGSLPWRTASIESPFRQSKTIVLEWADLGHASVEDDFFVLFGLAQDPEGIFALANGVNRILDHVAEQDNALVGGAEMFLTSIVDIALAFLGDAVLVV